MSSEPGLPPNRRAVLAGLAGGLATSLVVLDGAAAQQPPPAGRKPEPGWSELKASPTPMRIPLPASAADKDRPPAEPREAELWLFDGRLDGPVIRVRHGDEVRIRLVNATTAPLSLHWHGVRNQNAMDGVGGLTQAPVAPGASFEYRFTPPDPGTVLVRPLVVGGSSEPAGRGLEALLIVEEREPPQVDSDLALVLRDWRVQPDGALTLFRQVLESASAGRLGNRLTLGGKAAPNRVELRPGTRLRLRLVNGCNARHTAIRFEGVAPYVAAIDGQPTEIFEPLRSTLPFAPGARYDLLLDLPATPGPAMSVVALLGPGVPLLQIVVAGEAPARPALPPLAGMALNAGLPAEIKLQNALRRELTIAGGATRAPNGAFIYEGDAARIWTINGAAGAAGNPPLFTTKRGQPVVLGIANKTGFTHALHLHGHVFRLLHPMDDGWEPWWLDTILIPDGRNIHIAFIADNPGKWALSSTILERFDTGLWTWFEVT